MSKHKKRTTMPLTHKTITIFSFFIQPTWPSSSSLSLMMLKVMLSSSTWPPLPASDTTAQHSTAQHTPHPMSVTRNSVTAGQGHAPFGVSVWHVWTARKSWCLHEQAGTQVLLLSLQRTRTHKVQAGPITPWNTLKHRHGSWYRDPMLMSASAAVTAEVRRFSVQRRIATFAQNITNKCKVTHPSVYHKNRYNNPLTSSSLQHTAVEAILLVCKHTRRHTHAHPQPRDQHTGWSQPGRLALLLLLLLRVQQR
jgi:hypothetical protein